MLHDLSTKIHTQFCHSALRSIFPKLSAVILPGVAPVVPSLWNALHFCLLKSHPLLMALLKTSPPTRRVSWLPLETQTLLFCSLLGLFPSILIFTIVVSMTVTEVPLLKMELDSESHSYQHHTELIADAQ